jgi:MinD-like ATPase involved in chromosome partitioning or flagellar assembly
MAVVVVMDASADFVADLALFMLISASVVLVALPQVA